jgi:predicted Rossmann fold flavoprotein
MDIIVIGGGAAGFFGAIVAAETNPAARVTIIEAGRSPLGKVKVSGGGRCNVTHHCFETRDLIQHYPRGSKALRGAFSRFQPQDTVAWFEQRGVKLKTESDGRMFPTTDNSQTIIDCLTEAARAAQVQILTGNPALTITTTNPALNTPAKFLITLKNQQTLTSDRLLLATGSSPAGYRWAKGFGHAIQPPVPSLFTFKLNHPLFHNLAGVSVPQVQVKLITPTKPHLQQQGPLLITHWGVSGPAILKLSAWGARVLHEHRYRLPLEINWLPGENQETCRQALLQLKTNLSKKKLETIAPFNLPKRLWQRWLTIAEIPPDKIWAELNKQEIKVLSQALTQGRYDILGKGTFKDEFVTCGGIKLGEVNFKTMASKLCPQLYFAGEILDVDGVTGGFNFQNAWTTGWLAGNAIASPNPTDINP